MNLKKYVLIAVAAFLVVAILAIGISAEFSLTNIIADPYRFIEDFFAHWSPALSAAGTIIVAALAILSIYQSRRNEEKQGEQVIHALHDEIHSNLTDIIGLRFQISEKFRREAESSMVNTEDAPFQSVDTTVFDSMKNAGQLHRLGDMQMKVVFCYKLIKRYNLDGGFKPYQLQLLGTVNEELDKVMKDLEANLKFLPRYLKEERNDREVNVKKTDSPTFNPLSLGMLFFGFCLALWGAGLGYLPTRVMGWISISVSFCFAVAVLIRPFRDWLNQWVRSLLLILASTVFVLYIFGNLIGWLSGLSQISGAARYALFIVGFGWLFIFLLVVSNQASRKDRRIGLVAAVLFGIASIVHLLNLRWIECLILLAFGIGVLFVALGRWKVFDKFSFW